MNINPVLLKELRVRMRGVKSMFLIMFYLMVLAGVAFLVTINTVDRYSAFTMNPTMLISAYASIGVIQFLLIVFIAPALTSGAISGERERQTLDLLLSTKMAPRSIVVGKLFASISQVILLVFSSLPIFSIVFLFGGISFFDIVKLFLFYLISAILMGSIGIFFSTYMKKTTVANVMTYGFILFIIAGTAFLNAVYILMQMRHNPNFVLGSPLPITYINPMVGFISMLADQFGVNRFAGGIWGVFGMTARSKIDMSTIWIVNMAVDLAFSFIFMALSAMKLNPVKWKIKK